MRPIGVGSVLWFVSMLLCSLVVAAGFAWSLDPLARSVPLGEVFLFLATSLVFLGVSIFLYRVFLKFFPVPGGEIPDGSRQEFYYFVYVVRLIPGFLPRKPLEEVQHGIQQNP